MGDIKDLIGLIRQADSDGAIPYPIRGESNDNYRLRVAHAGAVIGIAFCQKTVNTPPTGEVSE